MEFRVDASQFGPNHGGGGGGFYRGRSDGQASDEPAGEEAREDDAPGALRADTCHLPENRRSTLGLFLPPLTAVSCAAPVDLAGIDDEIHRHLRVMTLMVIRLEQAFDARLHAEIGDVAVGF